MSTTKVLTYAGAIPFIACAILTLLGMNDLSPIHPLLPSSSMIAHSYGVIILCFVVGMQWGLLMPKMAHQDDLSVKKRVSYLLILTNILALAAWISMMIPHVLIGLSLCTLCFIAALYIDLQCKKLSLICSHVFKRRVRITSIVVICLLIIILSL